MGFTCVLLLLENVLLKDLSRIKLLFDKIEGFYINYINYIFKDIRNSSSANVIIFYFDLVKHF